MVWYKSAWLAAGFGTRREQKLNSYGKVVDSDMQGMLPWQLPITCMFLSLHPLTPALSTALCETLLHLGGKEGADRSSWWIKMSEEQNCQERYFKWHVPIDHRGSLKCTIRHWSGHDTACNPWLLQKPHAGRHRSVQRPLMPRFRTRAWVIARREARQTRAGPEMGSTTSTPCRQWWQPAHRPQRGWPWPHRVVTQGMGTHVGRWLIHTSSCGPTEMLAGLSQGVDATQPCQKHGEGMWGAGVPTRGCRVGTTLGGSVPVWCCVSPVSLRRASHERALKHNRSAGPRSGSCAKGVLSDAAAFPVIISLDKIPEQRTDTRIYSLLCVSTVHYEVWNKTRVHKYPTMKCIVHRELAPWNTDFCCSCLSG